MMMKDEWAGRQLFWSVFGTTLVERGSFLRSKSKGVNSTRREDREFVRFYNRRTGHTRPMSGRRSGQGSVSYSSMIRIQDLRNLGKSWRLWRPQLPQQTARPRPPPVTTPTAADATSDCYRLVLRPHEGRARDRSTSNLLLMKSLGQFQLHQTAIHCKALCITLLYERLAHLL